MLMDGLFVDGNFCLGKKSEFLKEKKTFLARDMRTKLICRFKNYDLKIVNKNKAQKSGREEQKIALK